MNEAKDIEKPKAERRLAPVSLLGHVITQEDIAETKEELDGGGHTTHEILMIATLCRVLAVSTHDHASDLVADGFTLRAEEADQRSILYANTADAICRLWRVA